MRHNIIRGLDGAYDPFDFMCAVCGKGWDGSPPPEGDACLRRNTPPPWAASDRAVAEHAKDCECKEQLARLVLDLTTLAGDLDRHSFVSYAGPRTEAADMLRAVLRRHGVLR